MILPIPGVTSFKVTKTDDCGVMSGYTEHNCIESEVWPFPGGDWDRSMSCCSFSGGIYGLEDGPEVDDNLSSWDDKHDSITITNLPETINFEVNSFSDGNIKKSNCSIKKSEYNITGMVYPCVSICDASKILLSDITFVNEKNQENLQLVHMHDG